MSTSLDGVTATTDGQGRFNLATRADSSDRCFTLTITASGLPTYSLAGNWGTGPDKLISLSPPQPATASCAP